MAKVRLDFVPPTEPDIAKLHILEAVAPEGPFNQIEVVTSVGVYPDYISYYTTDDAASATNWFSIFWETAEGVAGDASAPIQGNTQLLIHDVISRVMLRDPSLSEAIVAQSAEYVISDYLNLPDPYAALSGSVSYRILEGLTLMTLARSTLQSVIISSSSSDDYTAGLISQKASSSSSSKQNIDDLISYLIKEANRLLGISYSMKLLLEEISVGGGYKQLAGMDMTRLLIEVE